MQSTTKNRSLKNWSILGGNVNNGSQCGLLYLNANNDVGNANWNHAVRDIPIKRKGNRDSQKFILKNRAEAVRHLGYSGDNPDRPVPANFRRVSG